MRTALATLMIVCATQAAAQQCGPTADVDAQLRGQYGETVQGYGMDMAGSLMTVYANTATGTWTVTVSTAAGLTCVVGAGGDYEAVSEPNGVDG